MSKAPFIIIGMHRSGTSLLAKVLERSGIFMGVFKDHHYEAMHFLSENQQSMQKSGFDWLHPGRPSSHYYSSFSAETLYQEHFQINTTIQKYRLLLQNPSWGWKDPRNTYCLPMWLNKFPQAKVIHIIRNTHDVVRSLQNRNHIPGEVFSKEIENTDFCLQLYDQYITEARSYQSQLNERYLEVTYEDLVAKDPKTINLLNKFTGKPIEKALSKIAR